MSTKHECSYCGDVEDPTEGFALLGTEFAGRLTASAQRYGLEAAPLLKWVDRQMVTAAIIEAVRNGKLEINGFNDRGDYTFGKPSAASASQQSPNGAQDNSPGQRPG